jgi:hypothetical protein
VPTQLNETSKRNETHSTTYVSLTRLVPSRLMNHLQVLALHIDPRPARGRASIDPRRDRRLRGERHPRGLRDARDGRALPVDSIRLRRQRRQPRG